jgi:Carboxypeptidase regulatory-like domain
MQSLVLVVCVFACVCLLSAQTIDTGVLGTVRDPSAAAAADAEVTVTNVATGVQHTTKTSSDGAYQVRYPFAGRILDRGASCRLSIGPAVRPRVAAQPASQRGRGT